MDKNPPVSSGGVLSILGPGRLHTPQLLGPCAHVLPLPSLQAQNPCCTREGTTVRRLCAADGEHPHLPQLEEACAKQQRPRAAKKKNIFQRKTFLEIQLAPLSHKIILLLV